MSYYGDPKGDYNLDGIYYDNVVIGDLEPDPRLKDYLWADGWACVKIDEPQPYNVWKREYNNGIVFCGAKGTTLAADNFERNLNGRYYGTEWKSLGTEWKLIKNKSIPDRINQLIRKINKFENDAWDEYLSEGHLDSKLLKFNRIQNIQFSLMSMIEDEDGVYEIDPLSEEDLMEVEDLIERIEDILDRRITKKDYDDDDSKDSGLIYSNGNPIPTSADKPYVSKEKELTPEEIEEKEKKRLHDAYERAMKIY